MDIQEFIHEDTITYSFNDLLTLQNRTSPGGYHYNPDFLLWTMKKPIRL